MRSLRLTSPDRGRLLVCLDLQRRNLHIEPVSWATPPRANACGRLLNHARRADWSVVHVHRVPEDYDGLTAGAPIPGFEPRPTERVFLRRDASALANPDFAEIIRAARGHEVLLAGFDLRTSGLATALDAFNQGVPLTLLRDAFWTSPLPSKERARVEQTLLEGVLWDVVAPFVRVARVESVVKPTHSFTKIANDT